MRGVDENEDGIADDIARNHCVGKLSDPVAALNASCTVKLVTPLQAALGHEEVVHKIRRVKNDWVKFVKDVDHHVGIIMGPRLPSDPPGQCYHLYVADGHHDVATYHALGAEGDYRFYDMARPPRYWNANAGERPTAVPNRANVGLCFVTQNLSNLNRTHFRSRIYNGYNFIPADGNRPADYGWKPFLRSIWPYVGAVSLAVRSAADTSNADAVFRKVTFYRVNDKFLPRPVHRNTLANDDCRSFAYHIRHDCKYYDRTPTAFQDFYVANLARSTTGCALTRANAQNFRSKLWGSGIPGTRRIDSRDDDYDCHKFGRWDD